jgi:hypothetical protein
MQGTPGDEVNILGGHSIGHSKQKSVYVHVSYSERFSRQLFHCIVYTVQRATRHVLTRVAKCTDVDGGIFKNVLY